MQKLLFFLLALFSLSVQARANWNPYIMDHEHFVHLNDVDKRAVIVSTMELMVELESKYQKQVKTSGFNTERFQKYVQVLQKFQDLIIGQANAADQSEPLTKLALKFSELLKTLGDKGCIYGGYVSKIGISNGKKYCRHPNTMNPKIPAEKAVKEAYVGGGCPASNISCNPVVFGFKDSDAGKPFCVAAGTLASGQSHNVSYDCMKLTLGGDETAKKARLDVVAKAMAQSPKAFNNVHHFIFRTCACGETSIDKTYAAYIKPHRTCFGMMNSLRVINNSCQEQITHSDMANKFVPEWLVYFGRADAFPDLKANEDKDFDKNYAKMINSDPEVVKKLCDGTYVPPVIIPVDVPEDPPKDPPAEENKDLTEWTCTTKCISKEPVAPATAKTIECEIEKAGWNFTKFGTTAPVFTPALKAGDKIQIEDETKTEFTVKVKDLKTPPTEVEQKCPVTIAPVVAPVDGPKCTLAFEDNKEDPKKVNITATISGLKKEEVAVITWTDAVVSADKQEVAVADKTPGSTKKIVANFTIKDAPVVADAVPFTCFTDIPAITPTDATKPVYTIEATAEAALATSVKVNAVVTIDTVDKTEDLGTFKISWTRTGTSAPAVTAEETTPSVAVGDSTTVVDGTKTEEDKTTVTAGETGTGPTITETRVAADYEACASLLDDKLVSVAGPSCVTIPATEKKKDEKQFVGDPNGPKTNQPFDGRWMKHDTSQGGIN